MNSKQSNKSMPRSTHDQSEHLETGNSSNNNNNNLDQWKAQCRKRLGDSALQAPEKGKKSTNNHQEEPTKMSVSFKIQRTTTATKQQQQFDSDSHSSDNDEAQAQHHRKKRAIEFISDFDSTREPANIHDGRKKMISIPALPDRDFRAVHLARKQKRSKKELYKPEPVNSMGGSTKNIPIIDSEGVDKMNSKAIEGGLKPPTTSKPLEQTIPVEDQSAIPLQVSELAISITPSTDKPLTIEERAVKELLSQANTDSTQEVQLEAIPMKNEAGAVTETDTDEGDDDDDDSGDETTQFRKDVSKRPDSSTLEDYERIPVGQFGLALLKGMGWKEGTAATKRGRVGLVEAYVPQARPSLLGIGAKPLVLDSDPTNNSDTKKTKAATKPDKKYVPLLRKVIDHTGKTRSRSRSPSNGHSSSLNRSSSDSSSRSTRDNSSYRDHDSRHNEYQNTRERDGHRIDRERSGHRDDRQRDDRQRDGHRDDRQRDGHRDNRDRSYNRQVKEDDHKSSHRSSSSNTKNHSYQHSGRYH
ncbi:hypothetical protein H4Q26_016732 [Puccinia striiformis f. sp. tritici PST-130]|nr:hypothetical protein H4Q26_016732 [Puccinia striiformis f. sp. tritici PST-130]